MLDTHEIDRRTVGDLLHDFWDSSTLQGLPRVFTSRAMLWKCFWMVMFLLLIAGCSYQMYSIFDKFYKRETTTSVTLEYGNVDFPTVTICNHNSVQESRLLNITDQPLVDKYLRLKSGNSTEQYLLDLWKFSQERTFEEWEHLGSQGPVMLLTHGFLHHSGGGWSKWDAVNYARIVTHWYGNCFVLNGPQTQATPVKASRPGRSEGLWIFLNAQKHEYLYKHSRKVGFILDLHRFNTSDNVADVGLNIPTGYSVDLNVRQVKIKRLEPPYGKCSKEYAESFEEIYNFTYTVSACNHSCEHYQIAEDCGCYKGNAIKYYTKHQLETLQPCNSTRGSSDYECSEKVLTDIYDTQTKRCSCPLPCQEVRYDVDMSSVPLHYDIVWDDFKRMNCDDEEYKAERALECTRMMKVSEADRKEYVRDNFAMVMIYYRELKHESYSEHITYERSQFISDFGGNLGLWLGASIFTVLEIIELFTKITVTSAGNMQNRKHKHNTDGKHNNTSVGGADVPLKDSIV